MTENRRHIRIDSLNLSYVALDKDGNFVKQGIGRTLNVSESGILLETVFPININQKMVLSIGLEDDLVNVEGRVVYSVEDENGKFKTGIELIGIDETSLQILQIFIRFFTAQTVKV